MIAILMPIGVVGCKEETFVLLRISGIYLGLYILSHRQQPEHVAFTVRENGRAVAAYLRKVVSATITPFEIVFKYYEDGHLAKWPISRIDGAAEMSDFYHIYRGTCVKAEGAKF